LSYARKTRFCSINGTNRVDVSSPFFPLLST